MNAPQASSYACGRFVVPRTCYAPPLMRDLHEQCGVIGVMDLRGERDAVRPACRIARRLAHRGQLGAGVATVRDGVTRVLKGNGTVMDVLSPPATAHLAGATGAIAHTRYATSGSRDACLAQPFGAEDPAFAFGFNGTVTNYPALKAQLEAAGGPLEHDVDTEAIRRLLIEHLRGTTAIDVRALFGMLEGRLDGAFNLTMLTGGMLAAYRDHHGFHPLSYAVSDGMVLVASEDSAMKSVYPGLQAADVPPGSALVAAPGMAEPRLIRVREAVPKHCFFEWVYFSHFLSTLDGAALRTVRENFGRLLARRDSHLPEGQCVIAVPESSIVAAEGYGEQRGLRTAPVIRKNQDRRNFIEGSDRTAKAREKYVFTDARLEGESVVLIDDSIVRGDTMSVLVERLRTEKRPRAIHLRLACPPILSPCVYGIDFPTHAELLVRRFHHDVLRGGALPPDVLRELAAHLRVDSVAFLTPDDVAEAIGKPRGDLCMACVDGRYPTPEGRKLYPLPEAV